MSKWKCEICGVEFENFHAQGFDNKIYCPLCYFKRENQELKKQHKEYIRAEMKLKDELEKQRKEYQETYKDVREEIKEYKNQQKEFIEYLENEIERYRKTLSERPTNDLEYNNYKVTDVALEQIKIVLSKYKEIIGDKE